MEPLLLLSNITQTWRGGTVGIQPHPGTGSFRISQSRLKGGRIPAGLGSWQCRIWCPHAPTFLHSRLSSWPQMYLDADPTLPPAETQRQGWVGSCTLCPLGFHVPVVRLSLALAGAQPLAGPPSPNHAGASSTRRLPGSRLLGHRVDWPLQRLSLFQLQFKLRET